MGCLETSPRRAIRLWQQAKGNESTGYLNQNEAAFLAEEGKGMEMTVGRIFRDCADCPEMIVVPGGSFTMGSPTSEEGRYDDEGPQRRVSIKKFAVGVNEVTRGEFGRFMEAAGHSIGSSCRTYESGEWESRSGRSWSNPGFSQTDDHPVVCVNWNDAQAYVKWLSRKTRHQYRLLSESEWEYVARAGSQRARFWGESEASQCRYANGADLTAKNQYSRWTVASCRDGTVHTAVVGSYEPNGFGLHDVLGNVWEWVEDCWHDSYSGAPVDGHAWTWGGDCGKRVLRGGSWGDYPWGLRSAGRIGDSTGNRLDLNGFRIARTLTP